MRVLNLNPSWKFKFGFKPSFKKKSLDLYKPGAEN